MVGKQVPEKGPGDMLMLSSWLIINPSKAPHLIIFSFDLHIKVITQTILNIHINTIPPQQGNSPLFQPHPLPPSFPSATFA
jgi:hypothetical protein